MEFTSRRAGQIVAVALISLVVMQLIYFALYSNGAEINRALIWTAEAVAYLAVAVFALVAFAAPGAMRAAWAAVAVGGTLNAIQVGMGLAMFPPLSEAGEPLAPAFQAVLAGAFFLYFAGKLLFGFAATLFGLVRLRQGGGTAKAVGGLAVLAGLAAMAANTAAMGIGMDLVFPAGATGTVATLLLALTLRGEDGDA